MFSPKFLISYFLQRNRQALTWHVCARSRLLIRSENLSCKQRIWRFEMWWKSFSSVFTVVHRWSHYLFLCSIIRTSRSVPGEMARLQRAERLRLANHSVRWIVCLIREGTRLNKPWKSTCKIHSTPVPNLHFESTETVLTCQNVATDQQNHNSGR